MSNKNEMLKLRKEKLANYYYDLSKLILGGLGIGGISPIFGGDVNVVNWYSVVVAFVAAIWLAIFANRILKS